MLGNSVLPVWQHCRGGSGGLGGKAEQYRRRKEPSKAQGSAGWGGTDGIFNAVLLVPHMGIGQSPARGGFKVTLSSMRPGLFLAELWAPAAPTGLFWPSKRREEHQLAELSTLAGNPSTELEKNRWKKWGMGGKKKSGGKALKFILSSRSHKHYFFFFLFFFYNYSWRLPLTAAGSYVV